MNLQRLRDPGELGMNLAMVTIGASYALTAYNYYQKTPDELLKEIEQGHPSLIPVFVINQLLNLPLAFNAASHFNKPYSDHPCLISFAGAQIALAGSIMAIAAKVESARNATSCLQVICSLRQEW